MTELILHQWIEVNHYMRDDYRLLVCAMAARQIVNSNPELQSLARTGFSAIPVPGARSFARADLIGQRKALAKTMQTIPQVASLVMALWANAAESYINTLKLAGETAGIEFAPDFDWHTGMNGFYAFEDIPLLAALADGLGAKTTEKDYDHLKLAALWLGPAITNLDTLPAPPSDDSSAEPTADSFPTAADLTETTADQPASSASETA